MGFGGGSATRVWIAAETDVGVATGSATQMWLAVARNYRGCGGMVVGLSGRSSGWTELWSERAGLPRQGIKLGRTARPRNRHVPQGQKLGRKRMRRGVSEAPSGAGRGVSPRIARGCAETLADILRDSAGSVGYMWGWWA